MNSSDLHFGFRKKLPLILQGEGAECGLACLAMIASFHGRQTDLPALRQHFSISLKGTTLADLLQLAGKLQLDGRPVRAELEDLAQLETPCILHWDMTHFVVLKEVRRGRLIIHDPSLGLKKLTLAEASAYFTGVALELRPSAGFEFKNERRRIALSDLTGRVVGLKRAAAPLVILAIALELLTIAAPLLLQLVTDGVLASRDRNLLLTLCSGFALLVVMQTLIGGIRSWAALYFGTTLHVQWLSNLFAHLLRLPVAFFEKRFLGDLISRFDSVQVIQQVLSSHLIEALVDGLMAFLMLSVMCVYSVRLGLIALASVILYFVLRNLTFGPSRRATEEFIVHSARQHGFLIETLRGIQALKMFNREAQRKAKWSNLLVRATNAKLSADKLDVFTRAGNSAIFGLESILIVWAGALAILDGHFSVGMLFAFVAYKDQFNNRMSSLIDRLFEIRILSLQAERLSDIVLEPVDMVSARPMIEFARVTMPPLDIRSLFYRYSDTEPWLLQDLELRVEPGECIAITGASGAGKSTLIKLIAGLLQPQQGEILLGGLPAHRNRAEGGSLIGFVMQEDSLFSGTICENIHFFDDSPDLERVRECASLACIHDDIAAMPMGYETLVGDMGAAVSGGQKQRLLIARALYRKPSVLVLDEATSHLDLETEKRIAQTLRALRLTRIMVAHRPQTIAIADRVCMVDRGRLVAAEPTRDDTAALAGHAVVFNKGLSRKRQNAPQSANHK